MLTLQLRIRHKQLWTIVPTSNHVVWKLGIKGFLWGMAMLSKWNMPACATLGLSDVPKVTSEHVPNARLENTVVSMIKNAWTVHPVTSQIHLNKRNANAAHQALIKLFQTAQSVQSAT